MCLIIYRIRILLDETQVLLLLTFGAITAPLLIQVGLEMSAITLIERVIELWRVFFSPTFPLEVASAGVKPLRIVSKLVELLLCQYQVSSAACRVSQVNVRLHSGQG